MLYVICYYLFLYSMAKNTKEFKGLINNWFLRINVPVNSAVCSLIYAILEVARASVN